MSRVWGGMLLVLTVMFVVAAPSLGSVVVSEPGYTQQLVGVPGGYKDYGGLAVDALGNVYTHQNVGTGVDNVVRITPGGSVSVLAVMPGENLLGFHLIDNTLYVGTRSSANGAVANLYTLDVTQSSPTPQLFTSVTAPAPAEWGDLLDFAVAPDSWPVYPGHLIASSNYGLYAIDLDTGAATQFFAQTTLSALDFTPDGRLLVAQCHGTGSPAILEVSPSGASSVFYSPVGYTPDGLAVHPLTGEVFITCFTTPTHTIQKLDSSGSTLTTFAQVASIDYGWFCTPFAFSPRGGSLYIGLDESNTYTVRAIRGFPTAAEPAGLGLVLGGGVLLATRRKRK